MELKIAPEFGYVVLVCIFYQCVITWMAINVGKARKKYGVKVKAYLYPIMGDQLDKLSFFLGSFPSSSSHADAY